MFLSTKVDNRYSSIMIYLGGNLPDTDCESPVLWDKCFQSSQRVSVCCLAKATKFWPGEVEEVRNRLHAHGHFPTVTLGSESNNFGLLNSDVIFISGGNPFVLLRQINRLDLLKALRNFVDKGGKVFAAGEAACIFGKDIALADCLLADPDLTLNSFDLQSTKGLNLLRGLVLLPHYDEMEDYISHKQSALQYRSPITAIPRLGGLVVDEKTGEALNVGPGDVVTFFPNRTTEVWQPGEKGQMW